MVRHAAGHIFEYRITNIEHRMPKAKNPRNQRNPRFRSVQGGPDIGFGSGWWENFLPVFFRGVTLGLWWGEPNAAQFTIFD